MPEMTGAELIRKIKSKHKDLNCLMLSGQANSTQISELEKDKLLEKFIEKPWDEDELRDAISKLIATKTLS
jgi:response regulator RpfG family c-di-GMP phosphodiesterase